MSWLNDDLQSLSLEDKIEAFKELKELSYDYYIDVLDCSKSFRREKAGMDFEEALTKITDINLFTIIRRDFDLKDKHIEASISSLNGSEADVFIFLKIKPDHITKIKEIISKYE